MNYIPSLTSKQVLHKRGEKKEREKRDWSQFGRRGRVSQTGYLGCWCSQGEKCFGLVMVLENVLQDLICPPPKCSLCTTVSELEFEVLSLSSRSVTGKWTAYHQHSSEDGRALPGAHKPLQCGLPVCFCTVLLATRLFLQGNTQVLLPQGLCSCSPHPVFFLQTWMAGSSFLLRFGYATSSTLCLPQWQNLKQPFLRRQLPVLNEGIRTLESSEDRLHEGTGFRCSHNTVNYKLQQSA